MANLLPLNRPQRAALRRAVARELRWGLNGVSRELRRWRLRAETIPDAALRRDALHALDCKRGHTDGAALFWTLPDRPHPELLRLLVAYEVIYDYLDNVSERRADAGMRNGRQLFLALRDALAPDRPKADCYRFNAPHRDDGGYLADLVEECRRLPAFEVVRPLVMRETARASVLAINHEPCTETRDRALEAWAANEFLETFGLHWYELTAAASQSVVTFALLTVAVDPAATAADAQAIYDAYIPWFGYGVTMLDSYVDQAEDANADAHSYIAHYPSPGHAEARLCESVERAAQRLLALPHGERHAVMLGCMVAMYLSKNSAWTGDLRATTARIRRSGGTLTTVLLPILRVWRICNHQTTTT